MRIGCLRAIAGLSLLSLVVAAPSWHVKTTSAYSSGGTLTIESPSSNHGDLLFLFLSRTDSFLPLKISGWTRLAECFKSYNEQAQCWSASDCILKKGRYCRNFPQGTGRDLATVVFYRTVKVDKTQFSFSIKGIHPSWAIMTALAGVDETNPLRSVGTASCDNSVHSAFPSVEGQVNDVLLLSMANDDAEDRDLFLAPPGTTTLGYTVGSDETGFLYGKRLTADGPTGTLTTGGDGSYHCKDALIAMTLRPAAAGGATCLRKKKPCTSTFQCCGKLECRQGRLERSERRCRRRLYS